MAKADDVPANSVLPIPLPQMVVDDLAGVRKEAALRIKRLIDFLDLHQPQAWMWQNNNGNEREEENEHHDGEGYGGGCDDEPSLGSLDGRMSQLRWSEPDRR